MFAFPTNLANFFEISDIFCRSLFDVNLSWMVSASNNKNLISPPHNCSLLSRASKWSLLFDVLLDFCINETSMFCIALKLIDLNVSWVHTFKGMVTFLKYFFSVLPVGSLKDSCSRKFFSPRKNAPQENCPPENCPPGKLFH